MTETDPSKTGATSEGYASEESFSVPSPGPEKIRPNTEKIFVNRSINMSKITCYGFDMDYTLCEYISPHFDQLGFSLAKNFLVETLDYPPEILSLEYDPHFPVRGLWFDRNTGNLLKVDQFGKILDCRHGFRILSSEEIKGVYPGKIQRKDDQRIFVMNTVFNLAETCLVAALIHYFENKDSTTCTPSGWSCGGQDFTFSNLFKDIRAAIDDIHVDSLLLKKTCLSHLAKYVKKDERLPEMLRNIQDSGRKTFLLTNSDWWYTRQVMNYLLGEEGDRKPEHWMSYFNLVVVDACKPRFFSSGTPLQRVDTTSSKLVPVNSSVPGPVVYSGGDHATITKMLGAEGHGVLYAGDHLLADVIKCRKLCEWRTLLIVPELLQELEVTQKNCGLLSQLTKVETVLADDPDITQLKISLWDAVNELNKGFGSSGSLFRSGNKLTYFGSQVMIWADLYTGTVNNLASYDLDQRFVTDTVKLPHEREVEEDYLRSQVNSRQQEVELQDSD